jgi:hypothetical protein
MASRHSDVIVGMSTVPKHDGGGWALPGGGITRSQAEATRVATVIDALLRARAGSAAASPCGRLIQALSCTRRIANPDAARHIVSV